MIFPKHFHPNLFDFRRSKVDNRDWSSGGIQGFMTFSLRRWRVAHNGPPHGSLMGAQ